ncbi:MAG: methyl-accepting chemotaxis protein [Cyanobacteria bacterium P01_D01_bin.156]
MRSQISDHTAADAAPMALTPNFQQNKNWRHTLSAWLQLNSFGGRLFWMIMVGALTGIGGMAFLFSEMIKYQAEEQVQSTLDGQVNAIASVTEAAETLAYGLGISATTLHERQAQFPDTYRELTLQLFEKRSDFIIGLGIGQDENGLIVDQSWLFPYYWVDSSQAELPVGQSSIQYEDFADDNGEFYPDSDRYRDYFLPQKEIWTEPYEAKGNRLLTYYFPLFASDDRWLGTTLVDVDINHLSDLLNVPVFRQRGRFILLTRSGNVIADPGNADAVPLTYQDIPDLKNLWDSVSDGEKGFFEGEQGYWAYASVPGQDWLVFGFVPYGAVFNRIALITLAATVVMISLLSVGTFLAIRGLSRRLRPVLNQCNQLAQTDENLLALWNTQDELSQLSLAFFNMLEKLNLNEETIRRHEQKIQKETLHADRVSDIFQEFATFFSQQGEELRTLIRHLQEVSGQLTSRSQSADIQLDAVKTMGRALDGDVRRLPMHGAETLTVLEQQLTQLATAIEAEPAHPAVTEIQPLVDLLSKNVALLKVHERKWAAINNLQTQAGNITRAGEAAAEETRSMVDISHAMAEMLTKAETITTLLSQRAKSVLD